MIISQSVESEIKTNIFSHYSKHSESTTINFRLIRLNHCGHLISSEATRCALRHGTGALCRTPSADMENQQRQTNSKGELYPNHWKITSDELDIKYNAGRYVRIYFFVL